MKKWQLKKSGKSALVVVTCLATVTILGGVFGM